MVKLLYVYEKRKDVWKFECSEHTQITENEIMSHLHVQTA